MQNIALPREIIQSLSANALAVYVTAFAESSANPEFKITAEHFKKNGMTKAGFKRAINELKIKKLASEDKSGNIYLSALPDNN